MSVANLIARMKRFEKNAEIIFDDEEPIGKPTDLVMPRRRWFGRTGHDGGDKCAPQTSDALSEEREQS